MKNIGWIWILVTVLGLSACAAPAKRPVVNDDVASLQEEPIILSIEYVEYPAHNPGADMLMTQGFIGGVISSLARESEPKYDNPTEYMQALESAINEIYQDHVNQSNRFKITDERLNYKLFVKVDLVDRISNKWQDLPVGMRTKWVLRDDKFKDHFRVYTYVKTEQIVENRPGPYDPNLYDAYLDLANKSVEDFLLMLEGKQPKWTELKSD